MYQVDPHPLLQCFLRALCFVLIVSLLVGTMGAGVFAAADPAVKDRTANTILLYVGNPKAFVKNTQTKIDSANKTIVPQEDTEIKLQIGSNVITVNGQERTIDVPAERIEARTMVPLRAIGEALGKKFIYYNGLIIISDTDNLFDIDAESDLLNKMIQMFG